MLEFQHRTATLFPTILIEFKLENSDELNKSIVEHLYAEREKNPNPENNYSANGPKAWHSEKNLHLIDEQWSRDLYNLIVNTASTYANREIPDDSYVECWGMILPNGCYSNYHTHPGCNISGTYWVQVPKEMKGLEEKDGEEVGGRFCVPDPRSGASAGLDVLPTFAKLPVPGHGMTFGSWLPHWVESHYFDEDRIALSWNITLGHSIADNNKQEKRREKPGQVWNDKKKIITPPPKVTQKIIL